MNLKRVLLDFYLIAIGILVVLVVEPGPASVLPGKGKSIPCDDQNAQKIRVTLGRLTMLRFPVKPQDILPGEIVFDFKQRKNDLVIKSIKPGANTNAFVYMADRLCSFDIVTVPSGSDNILYIRDSKDEQMEAVFK
jgi:hypothetical protein